MTSDEGWYSAPVVAKAGQTWVHTVWLEGNTGGERVNVSIWEYNDNEQAIYRAELPVVLTGEPQQYAVKTTITDPAVTHIRALVRTSAQEKVSLYGDLATLRRVTAPSAVGTKGITTSNSDGAVLSPTIRGDQETFGDNQANYAVPGPNLLPNGSFEKPQPPRRGPERDGHPGGCVQPGSRIEQRAPDDGGRHERRRLLLGSDSRRAGADLELLDLARGEPRRRGDARGHVALQETGPPSPVGNLNFSTAISDSPAEYVVTGVIPPGEARYLRAVVRTRRIPQP